MDKYILYENIYTKMVFFHFAQCCFESFVYILCIYHTYIHITQNFQQNRLNQRERETERNREEREREREREREGGELEGEREKLNVAKNESSPL